jgi:hypothetical protein
MLLHVQVFWCWWAMCLCFAVLLHGGADGVDAMACWDDDDDDYCMACVLLALWSM